MPKPSAKQSPAANSDGGPLEPWEHLASVEIGEATDDLQHPYAIIADWRAKLDEREIKIFDSRIAAEPATATLQEVGDEFGITRERIRPNRTWGQRATRIPGSKPNRVRP